MGRKNIVSKRIIEILDGKLLRFTDILNEYEKLYQVKAFQSISRNLKILQHETTVTKVAEHFCLTQDLSSKITEEQIKQARARKVKLNKAQKKIDKATEMEMDWKFKQLIARNDRKEIQRVLKTLEKNNQTLALALQIRVPLQSEWDRGRIRKLVSRQEEQIIQLKKILKKGVVPLKEKSK